MGGIIKLAVGVVLALGVFGIWRYASAPEESGSGNDLLSITDKDWVKGAADAPVTLVEYTDFQCPACGAYYPILEQLSKDLDGKLKIVIRHYPLIQIHKNALAGSRAAEAAGRQGKFWGMYDLLYTNQAEWSAAGDPMISIFPSYAGRIGLDMEKFRQDMADTSLDDKINRDRETGNTLKLTGTPSFFLNGKKLDNPASLEAFKAAVDKATSK